MAKRAIVCEQAHFHRLATPRLAVSGTSPGFSRAAGSGPAGLVAVAYVAVSGEAGAVAWTGSSRYAVRFWSGDPIGVAVTTPLVLFLASWAHASGRRNARGRPPQHQGVGGRIHGQYQAAQEEREPAREGLGVEQRQEVVLDEAAGVAGLARALAEPVLERGERADPARELDERAPGRAGQVGERHAAPAERQEAPQHDERHEGEMQHDDGVGEGPVEHPARRYRPAAASTTASTHRGSRATIAHPFVGIEIRREIHHGELTELRRAALPLAATVGGMPIPACFFAALNLGRESITGWGIPMATDLVGVEGRVFDQVGASLSPEVAAAIEPAAAAVRDLVERELRSLQRR